MEEGGEGRRYNAHLTATITTTTGKDCMGDATCRRLRVVSLMNVRVMRPLGQELNYVKSPFGVSITVRQTRRALSKS